MIKIGDKCENRKTIFLFLRFLKEKKMYYLYMKYMEEYSNTTASTIAIHLNECQETMCYISYFFYWSLTKEGEDFWKKLNNSWELYIKTYAETNRKTNK